MKNQEGNIKNRLFKKGRLHAGILETCRRILHEFHVFFLFTVLSPQAPLLLGLL